MNARIRCFVLTLCLLTPLCCAAVPLQWIARGPGGGGAYFGPAMSPHRPGELWVNSDMSDAFVSRDSGATWRTMDFRILQGGNRTTGIQFTSDPDVLYGISGYTPVRSDDGGATWTNIPVSAGESSYVVLADPDRTNRAFASDYSTLYFSTNGGRSYAPKYTASDLHIAGAFFDGSNLYVGSQAGLLVSSNNGISFALATYPGIPVGEAMVAMAGTREAIGVPRLFAVTMYAGDVYPGITGGDYGGYRAIYRLDVATGATWQRITNGIGSGQPFFIATARQNTNIAYAAGASAASSEYPAVFKTTNGGATWTSVFIAPGNANIHTGWSGDDPGPWNWRKWSYGEYALGLAVQANDPQCAMISDLGFVHVTTNGGASWRGAYVWQSDQNPSNAATDKVKSYHGNGLENTSCWWLTWPDSNTLYASFTDMRGLLSLDGGRSWSFPPTLTYNSTYQTVMNVTGATLYAAASSVHDLYAWDRYLQDSAIDGGRGEVLFSTNSGVSWSRLHDFGRPVVAVAVDANNPNRLYASMVHSVSGGIYRTTNLHLGASSVWTKLAVPPRTQGHPYLIHVLADGTLVCSYSARIASGNFTDSSGVFVSTNNGASWLDRTASGMRYYTKDVVLDPHDPAQNTWYAGVWGEWGNSSGLGGLYVTTNRGVGWTRISTLRAVNGCTLDPINTNFMWVTTEDQGLWYTTNRHAVAPVFLAASNYPFRFPTRVFYNPWNPNEVWITSYGNGMKVGWREEPEPEIARFEVDEVSSPSALAVEAQTGQQIELSVSDSIVDGAWIPMATTICYDVETWFALPSTNSNPLSVFRARLVPW
ncbi:MAG: hypothetical protein J5I99_04200 [Verrucomicrobia bacterium]|nr:hypothetical protein [Verrucomicrobiota bacterium]